jgi:hypothetical protein
MSHHRSEVEELRRQVEDLQWRLRQLEDERDDYDPHPRDPSRDDLPEDTDDESWDPSSPSGSPSEPSHALRGSVPSLNSHPSRRRYRKATASGLATYGDDIARFAHAAGIKGATPIDAAMEGVSRFRRRRL